MFSIVPFDKIAFHVIRNSHYFLAAFTSASQLSIFSTKMNAVRALLLCFFKIRFNIIPPFTPSSSCLRFSHHFNMLRGRRVSRVETCDIFYYFMSHNFFICTVGPTPRNGDMELNIFFNRISVLTFVHHMKHRRNLLPSVLLKINSSQYLISATS